MCEDPNQSSADGEGNMSCDPRWYEDDYDAPVAGDGENVCLRPENPPLEPPTTGEIQQIAGTDILKLARVKFLSSDGPGYLALRERPDRAGKELLQLRPNDSVTVVRKLNIPGWSLVVTEPIEGQEGKEGLVGYVWDTFLSVDPPEPGAILHLIGEDEECEQIVKRYYGQGTHLNDDEIGFYANVLVYANQRTDGREPGISDATFFGLPNVEEGYLIWIPTKQFADELKGRISSYSASITGTAWKGVVDILEYTPEPVQYVVGFLAGVVQGVLECVWDAIVGIKDLIVLCLELLWEILKLEYLLFTEGVVAVASKVYTKVKQFWDQFKWEDVKDALEGWLSNVEHKFFHPNFTERGHFHGYILGYIFAEVVLAIWTGGTVAAAKWSGRLGRFARFINKFKWVAAIIEHGEETAGRAQRIARHLIEIRWRFRNADGLLEALTTRIAREKPGKFVVRYSRDDVEQMIAKGRSLGLTELEIEDMLFIGCRNEKAITPDQLMTQMSNLIEVRRRGFPFRFSSKMQFQEFKAAIRRDLEQLGLPIDDVRLQGSALRTEAARDIDIALFVERAELDRLLVKKFSGKAAYDKVPINLDGVDLQALANHIEADELSGAKRYNASARTMMHAVQTGKVRPGDISNLRKVRKGLEDHFGDLDISVMAKDSGFDLSPFERL